MSYLPFPSWEFEHYVRSMPQGEAQTALIFLVNYLIEREAAMRDIRAVDEMNGLKTYPGNAVDD